MMNIKRKRQLLHALLFKLGALPNKKDILSSYGVTSTTELTEQQLDDLIERLKIAINKRYNTTRTIRQWRSNVLVMLNKCGVYADNNDWERVNKFLLDKRIAGKMLYEMNIEELKTLYRKLASIAKKRKEKLKKPCTTISQ
ncbi:hypothetical protein ACT29H_01820 [Thermophagus sp. OGC60D27]|uniref:hypothetical protein n=1 Tax=Thermophagus sp. OGC60D27 TaxID=3458415 RepID=UPI0040382080